MTVLTTMLRRAESAGVRLRHWTGLAEHAGVLAAIHYAPQGFQDCSIARKSQVGLPMHSSRAPVVVSVLTMYLSRTVLTVMVDVADVSACQRGSKVAGECRCYGRALLQLVELPTGEHQSPADEYNAPGLWDSHRIDPN